MGSDSLESVQISSDQPQGSFQVLIANDEAMQLAYESKCEWRSSYICKFHILSKLGEMTKHLKFKIDLIERQNKQ